MAAPDNLRYAKIPLTHGSGAMPAVGFGTLIPDPLKTREATKTALEVGFRHFDCSERYRNEQAVGEAMAEVFKAGKIRRQDVFVTTKVWNNNHRPERVKPAFEASCRRLQLDDMDCYLIHTPFAFQPGDEQDPRDARATSSTTRRHPGGDLAGARAAGRRGPLQVDRPVERHAGKQLKEIVAGARIKPAVVQVESHPYLPEWDLLDFCREQGIVLLAFAALGHAMSPACSTTR